MAAGEGVPIVAGAGRLQRQRDLAIWPDGAGATVWPLLTGGCRTFTDPVAALRGAGFAIDDVRRLRFPAGRVTLPSAPTSWAPRAYLTERPGRPRRVPRNRLPA